jgi:hypothetical protein
MKDNGDPLLLIASALAACLAIGCDLRPIGPPCVDGNQAGEALTVRLGVVYDAASDYWFDARLNQIAWRNPPSCAGRDGLQTDSVLTFILTEPASSRGGCSPWRATLQPEALASPGQLDDYSLPYLDGVTMADASMAGVLAGHRVFAARGLFTPSGDPAGVLAMAQRPPLAVTRGLDAPGTGDICFDAWVAAWEPAP